MNSILASLNDLLYLAPAILIALTFHEVAHGYVSYRLGDPTPLTDGRLSLNPIHHLDPIGTLMLVFFRFGWAKPVMVNPGYYKNPKAGMALVAIAGPLANFVQALIAFVIMTAMLKIGHGDVAPSLLAVYKFFYIYAFINIGLGIFNLIPVPPLDGSKFFGAFLPESLYFRFTNISGYGFLVVMLLLYFGLLNGPLQWAREQMVIGLNHLADGITFFL